MANGVCKYTNNYYDCENCDVCVLAQIRNELEEIRKLMIKKSD